MSDHPDLANLIGRSLDSIASITHTADGVRVTTHCMYPSNGLVQVTVRGDVETIVASDEGGAVGEALSAGIPIKDYNRTLAHLIIDQGLSISDGVIFTPRIQIEAVSAAIIHVANASQYIARWLYEHMDLDQPLKCTSVSPYKPAMVAKLLRVKAEPAAKIFDNTDDLMNWLDNRDYLNGS